VVPHHPAVNGRDPRGAEQDAGRGKRGQRQREPPQQTDCHARIICSGRDTCNNSQPTWVYCSSSREPASPRRIRAGTSVSARARQNARGDASYVSATGVLASSSTYSAGSPLARAAATIATTAACERAKDAHSRSDFSTSQISPAPVFRDDADGPWPG
jgi:hypothetical protein